MQICRRIFGLSAVEKLDWLGSDWVILLMEEIRLHHLGCIKPVVDNGINCLAGFLPSTVSFSNALSTRYIPRESHDGSMGLIYLHALIPKTSTIHVGKYTGAMGTTVCKSMHRDTPDEKKYICMNASPSNRLLTACLQPIIEALSVWILDYPLINHPKVQPIWK